MTRARNTPVTKRRRKKILKQAKGYFGSKRKLFKTAKEQVSKSLIYAYRDRKKNKSCRRQTWIVRLNIACREKGLNYSRFIRLLTLAQIKLNRKQLTEMPEEEFITLVNKLKNP
jgi:large subunit ribosomal protein L20